MNTDLKKLQSGLIRATNAVFSSLSTHNGFKRGLEILGKTLNVDNVYICQHHTNKDRNEMYLGILYEWSGDAVENYTNIFSNEKTPYSRFSKLKVYENLSEGRSLKFNLKKLPQELRSEFPNERIKSILLNPLMVENNYWGFIGLEDFKFEREWSAEEIKMITKLTEVIAISLQEGYENGSINNENRNASNLIDLDNIISLTGNEAPGFDFFVELLDVYLRDIPSACKEIDLAVKNNDHTKLQFFAHKLGGSLRHLGATGTLGLSNKLEEAGREKIIDGKIAELNVQLQEVMINMLMEISSLRNKYFKLL